MTHRDAILNGLLLGAALCLSGCFSNEGPLLDRQCTTDSDCRPEQACMRGYCNLLGAQCIAEACDGIDNDCDGEVDEGNPSRLCPVLTNASPVACVEGHCQSQCIARTVDVNGDLDREDSDGCECVIAGDTLDAEFCNGLDDDCDGELDEGMPRLSSCPRRNNAEPDRCAAGVCTYLCRSDWADADGDLDDPNGSNGCECPLLDPVPFFDLCDGVDNDCDGYIDEGSPGSGASNNTSIDILNKCPISIQDRPGALPTDCIDGQCVYVCIDGVVDLDENMSNGCECTITEETCNNRDDNCDNITDNIDGIPCNPQTWIPQCLEGYDGLGVMCNTSSQRTGCNHFGGVVELCGNGIDDNCLDGQIDDRRSASLVIPVPYGSSAVLNQLNPRLVTVANNQPWVVWSTGESCGMLEEGALPRSPPCTTIRWRELKNTAGIISTAIIINHADFDAAGHTLGMDLLIQQTDHEQTSQFRRIVLGDADMSLELPYRHARLATSSDGSKAALSGVPISDGNATLVVHELQFDTESLDSVETHVQHSAPVWVWSAPDGVSHPLRSSLAFNDNGDAWLVAWSIGGQLYWKLQNAPTTHTFIPSEPGFLGVVQTPEVVHLGEGVEATWAIVYTASLERSNQELANTAYIFLDAEGERIGEDEIEELPRKNHGKQHRFAQATRVPDGLMSFTLREPHDGLMLPIAFQVHRPSINNTETDGTAGLETNQLSRPHPVGTSDDDRIHEFFPLADQLRMHDIHVFQPTEGDAVLYVVWTYARLLTSDISTETRRWRLMWSEAAIPETPRSRLRVYCSAP